MAIAHEGFWFAQCSKHLSSRAGAQEEAWERWGRWEVALVARLLWERRLA